MNQYETYPDAVRDLQTRLRRLAEDDSRLPQVPIDGVYASLTRQAMAFHVARSTRPSAARPCFF